MSNGDFVPIRTQAGQTLNWTQYRNITKTQLHRNNIKNPPVMVVYIPAKLSETKEALMKRCQSLLEISVHHSVVRLIRHTDQIRALSPDQRNAYFVIPEEENHVIRKIREHFSNLAKILLPRAVIEALCHYKTRLPSRSFTISLSMHDCNIFLSIGYKAPKEIEKRKELERRELLKRILEMGGNVVTKWGEGEPVNVVVTDNASSKHCISAHSENIPVVSRHWIDSIYECEKHQDYYGEEEPVNAKDNIKDYIIKPFYGLHFKIALNDLALQKEAKILIVENAGQVVYGDEDCLTHVVRQERDIKVQQMHTYLSQGKKNLHYVGLNWLRKCSDEGRCIGLKEYRSMTQAIKPEHLSPDCTMTEESFPLSPATPPMPPGSPNNNDENYHQAVVAMPPPIDLPRPQRQQQQQQPQQTTTPYSMSNDSILRSLFTDQQTVCASTQIRCLPDPELQIEPIYEPSQQLFWDDARNS